MPRLPRRGGPATQTFKPYPYQLEGIEWLRKRSRGLLADEMGLGKSNQALLASEGRTLIVAPKMILVGGTWDDEIARWVPGQEDRFTQVAYTSLNQRDGRKITNLVKPEYEGPWDTVILDEAHYIKGRATSWTKLVLKLGAPAENVYALTGTPVPNWAKELFTLLQLMHPDEARPGKQYGSYNRWINRWFDTTPATIYVRGVAKEVPNVGALLGCVPACDMHDPTDPCEHYRRFFEENLGGVFLRRLRDEVLTDLPPLTVERVLCPMVPAQKRAYNQVRKEALAELADGSYKVAWAETSKHMMCEQIATGVEVLDPGAKGASGKLDRLAYDLADRDRPTLVVAHYRASVEAAERVAVGLGKSVRVIHGGTPDKDRESAVRAFQSGKLDVLVGSLETISAGLTLTAADMIIFLETSYKPSTNEQAKRRIHRPGQDRPCLILDYVTPDSVDERKRELIRNKSDHQVRTFSAGQIKQLL